MALTKIAKEAAKKAREKARQAAAKKAAQEAKKKAAAKGKAEVTKAKKPPRVAAGGAGKGGGGNRTKGPKAQVQGAIEKKLDRRAKDKAEKKAATGREKALLNLRDAMKNNKKQGKGELFKQPKAEAGARAERMMRGRRLQAQKQMQKAYEANMKKLLDPRSGLYKDKALAAELNKMRQRGKIDRGFEAALRKDMKAKADKIDAAEKRILAIAANPGKRKK